MCLVVFIIQVELQNITKVTRIERIVLDLHDVTADSRKVVLFELTMEIDY